MKFSLKQYLVLLSCLVSTNAAVAQGYDVEGTDYYEAKATTQILLEDASNLYIEMAKSFACVISDSRPDATPNGVWSALLSENKCGLNNGDAATLASGVAQSSRASNELPQELSMWVDTASGDQFVVAVQLHESAEEFAPYGRWSFAYYMHSSPRIPGETFTAEDSPSTGFVLVSKDDDPSNAGGVVIEGYDSFYEPGDSESVNGKFIFSADLKNSKFIGRDMRDGYETYDIGHVGQANEDYYYQVSVTFADDGTIEPGSEEESCFARNSTWKTGYKADLFDYATGEKIPFTGAFSFKQADQPANRGYYGTWGVWLADEDTRLNPSDPTMDIVTESNANFDLIWSPGDLLDSGGASVLKSSEFLNAVGGTQFTCSSACFTSVSAPYSFDTIVSADGVPDDGSNEKYILTNVSHNQPLTLFHDVNGNGAIDPSDKPIRYDFSVNWDHENQTNSYSSYSSDASDTFSWSESELDVWRRMDLEDSDGESFIWQPRATVWDHVIVAMQEDGSVYEMSEELTLEKNYNFSSDDVNGSRERGNDASGDFWILAFDSPHNNPGTGAGDCLEVSDDHFICEIDLDALEYNNANDPEDTNTKFTFDGQSLRSQYYGGVETKLGWINVLNPKNGVILSDVNDQDKKYVVVNREMGEHLDRLDEGDEAACNDIAFTSLATLGLDLNDVPEEGDYVLPQFLWSDKPEDSGSCKVVIGELGNDC